jgi:RNA polymerase sigma-70 factor (ECF subfamily)
MPQPTAPLDIVQSPSGDADLLERARAGDGSAFEAIMRRHNRLLFRSARGIVSDDAEAQDVVQEAYLRAFTHLHSFRGDAALGTWLSRIAINIALDSLRKNGRLVPLDDEDAFDGHTPESPMSMNTHLVESPDVAAERGELRALLQSSIERLPPIYRSVFILRAVEEASVDETAYSLQVSDDVVKTRYVRARAMLRDMIDTRIQLQAPATFEFAGARCDAIVTRVLAELLQRGLISQH